MAKMRDAKGRFVKGHLRCNIPKAKRITLTCENCGKSFKAKPYEKDTAKYCSRECANEAMRGRPLKEETKKKISRAMKGKKSPLWNGGSVKRKCQYCGKEFKVKRSQVKAGKGKYCSKSCSAKSRTGKDAANWQGGKTPEQVVIRTSEKYKNWAEDVKNRDNFTCQICGDNSGGNLHSNHILKFSKYASLRFKTNNGITLCKKCHIGLVTHNEADWYSYFIFNLKTRGIINDKHIPRNIEEVVCLDL